MRPATGIKSGDKTVFTLPPLPPSVINDDYFQQTPRTPNVRLMPSSLTAPDLRRTPSSPATTSRSSPVFSDTGSGRAWSEFSRISHDSSRFSPATTPPLSPVEAKAPSGRSWLEDGSVRQNETPKHGDVRGSIDEDDSSDFFGDDDVPVSAAPEDLWAHGAVAESHVAEPKPSRPVTRRPIEELRAYKIGPKKTTAKKTTTPQRKTVAQKPVPVRTVAKPKEVEVRTIRSSFLHLPTVQQTSSSRGIKRPASPAHLFVPPAKRQTTQANAVRTQANVVRKKAPLPPTKLESIRWMNKLKDFEHLVYEGKQGPGEIPRVEGFLKELKAKIEVIDDKWVVETVRMRDVKGVEERKNKLRLLEDVVAGYERYDAEGTVASYAEELLFKWRN